MCAQTLTPLLSLSLIRGSLDQVSSTVDITWIQPRVLEGSQLETLCNQFTSWRHAVGHTELAVETQRLQAIEGVLAP